EVPSLAGQVTAPSQPVIITPFRTLSMVPRSNDLSFTWSGGGAGELRVSLAVPQMLSTPGVECAFASNTGAGAIPTAALRTLPAGQGFLVTSVVSESDLQAGTWKVALTATTGTVDMNGNAWDQLSVILQ